MYPNILCLLFIHLWQIANARKKPLLQYIGGVASCFHLLPILCIVKIFHLRFLAKLLTKRMNLNLRFNMATIYTGERLQVL